MASISMSSLVHVAQEGNERTGVELLGIDSDSRKSRENAIGLAGDCSCEPF
jgi:hypothetical protein